MTHGDPDALHELRDLFRDYASLSMDLEPSNGELGDWPVCSKVVCDGPGGGTVAVFASAELAMRAADNLLCAASTPAQQIDAIKELSNVLAGQAYNLLQAGRRPKDIGVPLMLLRHEGSALWAAAAPETRYALVDNGRILGGAIVALSGAWSSQWV